MAAEEITPGVYAVPLGYVNAFFLAGDDGVTLIDCGLPKKREPILRAVAAANRQPAEVKHILITHHHYDHVGSLAALKEATAARAYVHALDAPVVRGDEPHPKANKHGIWMVLGPLLNRMAPSFETSGVDVELSDGQELPLAGGVTVVHTPGHTPGHASFLVPSKKVLFVGDAAGNFPRLGEPLGAFTADRQQAKDSIRRIAELKFDVACFGHGRPLRGEAHLKFRRLAEKLAR
jgi:glyoxylase-like metal-dependent hydrolase (beta-lactamase superfamily II)